MHELNKSTLYSELLPQAQSLLADEPDWLANMAQFVALLFHTLPDVNWVGFYLYKEKQLVLGPFQGKVACGRIPIGKGVCGTCALRRETIIVPNVHAFPGHIACDITSQSEIVLPLIKDSRLLGVLDIDSPSLGCFDEVDAEGLKKLIEILLINPNLVS